MLTKAAESYAMNIVSELYLIIELVNILMLTNLTLLDIFSSSLNFFSYDHFNTQYE